MGGEQVESLSDDLERWVDEKARELDTTRADVVARAVAAYRLVSEHGADLDDSPLETTETATRLSELEDRVAALDTDLDEKIADVRRRVVQVKRESDQKAPLDHDHESLSAHVDAVDDAVEQLDADVTRVRRTVEHLEGDVETLDERVDSGFSNYESVLEYLTDTADETTEKLDTLAAAVVDLRERARDVEQSHAELAAGTNLKRQANRAGVETARCEQCEASVHLALLDTPYCPHCGATFDDVRPKRGFFGTATLSTGDRPALDGPTTTDESPEDLFAEDREE
jgi:chromosome segregation ATPase